MMRRLLLVLAFALAPVPRDAVAATPSPCGLRATPPETYEHVVWIWFENHGYGQIIGSRAAPVFNHTAAGCGLATSYQAIAHPSLPNYIAATSGLAGDALRRFSGDCNAVGPCRIGAPSLFEQAVSWGAYEESMRRPCKHRFTAPYAASHNPAVYYRRLTDCAERDVNLKALPHDLDAGTLPAFAFITPNLCHSMHSCGVGSGDAWLRGMLGRLTSSAAYQAGTMAIFVTFDESDGGDNHVATLVVSPTTVPGTRAGGRFDHYALLRTTEELLGIDAFLGRAAGARSMRAAFDL
jgi:hypothetical protein